MSPLPPLPGVGTVRLVRLPLGAMEAMLAGDLAAASAVAGVPLTGYLLDHAWLWRIRVDQVRHDPESADWVARAAVVDGDVVGHVGFHGPPDDHGMVEVAYSVDPVHRRRGLGRALLAAALDWAAADPRVRVVRASVSPGNVASLGVLRPFGFSRVGEQWDDEDGLEVLYELELSPPDPPRAPVRDRP